MRLLNLVPIAALVVTAPAAIPQTAAARPGEDSAARSGDDADTICARYQREFLQGHRYGFGGRVQGLRSSHGAVVPLGPPPPPPLPPSPPPPAPMVAPSAEIAASGAQSAPRAVSPAHATAMPGYTHRGEDRERYAGEEVASVQAVAQAPVSTFSIDVDTGSYANVRRMLTRGEMPPQGAVRTEEMLNYFRYDYPAPRDRGEPFTVNADMATTPWNPETRLLRVGLRGYDLPRAERPPANLVFLVDVSGSMAEPDKLPLVQCSLDLLARRLTAQDRVSIVVYAGAAGQVLAPTADKGRVIDAISRLQAGGSTAGAEGIQLAYRIARENRIEGGINRVVLATDGDFNVGVTDNAALIDLVEREREAGVTLTTLGYGTGNYNEAMMERIADHGNGNYAYIDSPREAQKVLDDELSSTLFTIASDVKIQVEFNPAFVSEYRLIGYENRALREQDFDNDKVDAGEIGAGHQVTALYEIVPVGRKGWLPDRRYPANRSGAAENGAGRTGELAWLKLRYKLPGEGASRLVERPLANALVRSARAPAGDMAFAAAVAAFGQKLRGDPWLGDFAYADARRLAERAGPRRNYWRGEFIRLTQMAERQGGGGGEATRR